jgi:hypothetical protein
LLPQPLLGESGGAFMKAKTHEASQPLASLLFSFPWAQWLRCFKIIFFWCSSKVESSNVWKCIWVVGQMCRDIFINRKITRWSNRTLWDWKRDSEINSTLTAYYAWVLFRVLFEKTGLVKTCLIRNQKALDQKPFYDLIFILEVHFLFFSVETSRYQVIKT